ncbi:MAG: cation diffusion facilitator family transporter [Dysgonamonadaceae bacterium]|jgi:cation diffusion facilitator family transporter|nr:cation diffusion facilitator family transporter [Dysgonamonadaceae bacterium]
METIKEKKRVAIFSIIAAIFLTGSKFVVGIITGSLGLLSEALHSCLDLVAAVVTYFSVRVSDKPADKEHHFGHGKVENMSALIQTILLLVTCGWIIYEAINRLVTKNLEIEVNVWAYIIIITSIFVDISRSRSLSRVAKKHNSQALEADALHFSTDIWSSCVVLLGLICSQFGFYYADPIAALFVALIVLYVCYKLGKKAFDILLDKAPAQSYESVIDILDNHSEIQKYHNLKLRTAGADTFVSFNIHLEPTMSFTDIHTFCDHLEKDIQQKIPRCEVYIHAEPQNLEHINSED